MTITTAVLVDYTRPSGNVHDLNACTRSGDWILGATNTGQLLVRIHAPTDTVTWTDPWQSGAQDLRCVAVRPNGNVCFFRNSGTVHEVVPSTGATSTWSAGVALYGSPVTATVGELAFLGNRVVNMSTHTTSTYSTGLVSALTVRDPSGDVWAIPGTAVPAQHIDPSTLTVTATGASPAAGAGIWQPFLFDGSIWWPGTGSQIIELDPTGPTYSAHSVAVVPAGLPSDRGDGTAAGVRRLNATNNHAMQWSSPMTLIDGPTGLPSFFNGVYAAIGFDRHMYVIGSDVGIATVRIVKVTFEPLPRRGGWSVGMIQW